MEIKTLVDKKALKEMLKPLKVLGTIITWIFSIGFFVYLIVAALLDADQIYSIILISLPLALGIIFLIFYKTAVNSTGKIVKENVYILNDEYMEIHSLYRQVEEGKSNLYYQDIFKIKETKEYYFIYINKASAYPVLKINIPDIDRFKELVYKFKQK